MHPRLRRLVADQAEVTSAFACHPRIRIVSTEGDPAEKYVVEYRLKGLVPCDGGGFTESLSHQAQFILLLDYPRRPPFCRMLTPVFHPNIDPQKICIGDHWSAGQKLTQLIVRVGEMISYQSYNVKSPLNGAAAAWAEDHLDRLPLEAVDLMEGR